MTEIFLVRHGQAAFGTDDYDRLSDLGWQQARRLGDYFRKTGLGFDTIMSGTLRRHRETVEGLSVCLGPESRHREDPALNEFKLGNIIQCWRQKTGQWEPPLTRETFPTIAKQALLTWYLDRLPNVEEDWGSFSRRVGSVFDTIDNGVKAKRILIVTSGGTIGALLQRIMELSPEGTAKLNLSTPNTGVTRLRREQRFYELVGLNELAHLDRSDEPSLVTLL